MQISLIFIFLFALVSHAVDSSHGVVIGIDLGTTYSCVAVHRAGRVDIIPNDQGNRVTPSWVAFNGNERLVGDSAKHVFHIMPSQTVFGAKRLLGRSFEDSELQADIQYWPVAVVNNNGRAAVRVTLQGKPKVITPQEISAMILAKLKETAEAYLGHNVTHAVITVPAYFNDEQRQATKDAGRIAGLKVLRLLNEPTAAALAHGLGTDRGSKSAITVVYDLGGGTFDVSLLRVQNGVFEVLATAGIARLGGEDFDNRIIDYFVIKYQKETKTNVISNKRAMSKLKCEVERAKRALSSQLTARLEIESLEGGNDFSGVLTRAKFEELNLDLFQRTLEPISQVLRDARLSANEVDHVVLVGGSTRIPKIRELLRDFFNGKEPEMAVNPDEAVAYGAAIQGSILSGARGLNEDLVLIDVCPFTLGIATSGGVFNRLIERNSPIPIQKSEIFSTATDNQKSVLIQVYQGENDLTKENALLGTFKLTGIPVAARGVPQIEVVFALDENGILVVSARDQDSGTSESIIITSENGQLDTSEINRMTREAQDFASQDKMRKEQSRALNELQQMISTLRVDLAQQLDHDAHRSTLEFLNGQAEWAESFGASVSTEELRLQMSKIERRTRNGKSIVSAYFDTTDVSLPSKPGTCSAHDLTTNGY